VLTKEIGMEYPNFRTYRILLGEFHIAPYRGLADLTVKLWILILVVAGIVFILDSFKSPRQILFPLSLALCVGFNFALHLCMVMIPCCTPPIGPMPSCYLSL
jgi:hypothetical protein